MNELTFNFNFLTQWSYFNLFLLIKKKKLIRRIKIFQQSYMDDNVCYHHFSKRSSLSKTIKYDRLFWSWWFYSSKRCDWKNTLNKLMIKWNINYFNQSIRASVLVNPVKPKIQVLTRTPPPQFSFEIWIFPCAGENSILII